MPIYNAPVEEMMFLFDHLKDNKNYKEIDKYCKLKKIDWFASAWDLNSLDFLDSYNIKYNKIASAMIVDTNFLKKDFFA